MTRKLEELLNLPDSKDIVGEELEKKKAEELAAKKKKRSTASKALTTYEQLDKITAALPRVKGLNNKGDEEIDDIAERALKSYEDLMDLGMNVEQRYAGRIFEVAGSMLKTSLDAKTAKLDKKLKMVDLQLKKEKQDNDLRVKETNTGVVNGDGVVVSDRNSLLASIKGNTAK
jgi:hypothetical protein